MTAYILDSEDEESPFKIKSRGCKPNRSIDEVSEIIESVSRDVSPLKSPKIIPQNPISQCNLHG